MRKIFQASITVGIFTMASFAVQASSKNTELKFALKPLAFLGDPAPNGGEFVFDFEPYAINNRGDVGFGADLSVGGIETGEGIFIRTRAGDLVEVVRAGDATPEGGTTFGRFFSEKIPMNVKGDLAFTFDREPVPDVVGVNSGVYRFKRKTRMVTPVVLPGDPAPGGGEFAGALTSPGYNNRGDIAFAGVVTGADIDPLTPPGIDGLGAGVFIRDRKNRIVSVIRPGDRGPAGGVFDYADLPTINDRGDLTFFGHEDVDECLLRDQDQGISVGCLGSVYFKSKTGRVISLARQGDPAPGGGVYRFAFRPVINNRGEVVFLGDLTPAPGFAENVAVFLFADGSVMPVVRPGDVLPGGGVFVSASPLAGTLGINQRGDVVFGASLIRDGNQETGLYMLSRGVLQLVAKTGTEIPNVGTIIQLQPPDFVGQIPFTGVGGAVNDLRQVIFMAAVDDANGGPLLGVLFRADPKGSKLRK